MFITKEAAAMRDDEPLDYRKMYHTMIQQTEAAMRLIREVQLSCQQLYIDRCMQEDGWIQEGYRTGGSSEDCNPTDK